jgi:hypothetical protein
MWLALLASSVLAQSLPVPREYAAYGPSGADPTVTNRAVQRTIRARLWLLGAAEGEVSFSRLQVRLRADPSSEDYAMYSDEDRRLDDDLDGVVNPYDLCPVVPRGAKAKQDPDKTAWELGCPPDPTREHPSSELQADRARLLEAVFALTSNERWNSDWPVDLLALTPDPSDDFPAGIVDPAFLSGELAWRSTDPPLVVRGKNRDHDLVPDNWDACPDIPGVWGRGYDLGCPRADRPAPGQAAPPQGAPAPAPQPVSPPKPSPAPQPAVAQPRPAPQPAPSPAPQVAVAPTPSPQPRVKAPLPSIDEPARSARKSPRDSAVVVGLEDYAFVPDVPFAKRDAQAFETFLLYTRGVPQDRVQTVIAGGDYAIREALTRAVAETGPGGTVWFYFAGHGAAHPSTGERILLGDDVRADPAGFAARAVTVAEIEKTIAQAGALPVVLLDTCYSGVGRSGAELLGGRRFVVPSYAAQAAQGGLQWNAAQPDQLSGPLEGTDHGAFTYFAVGALRGWADGEIDGRPDGQVTAEEAQAYVRRALRARGKNDQQPALIGSGATILVEGAPEKGPEL